jgi:inosose dehydratase
MERIGAAPISWGVCEVPGWGVMLPATRVLGEMRSLGITATELGAPGFLPRGDQELIAALADTGMTLIGGFVPLVLHDRARRGVALDDARSTAELFAAAGGTMFVTAVVVDAGWSPRRPLTGQEWDHVFGMLEELDGLCDDLGLGQALHPHVGTLVETADDVKRVLDHSDVSWCLDTGHLFIGGYDPARFAAEAADRVAHVHLKDVRAGLSATLGAEGRTLHDAVVDGVFPPLGRGDVPVAETVRALEERGYAGWYVLEQDIDLGPVAPASGSGPLDDMRASIDLLTSITAG